MKNDGTDYLNIKIASSQYGGDVGYGQLTNLHYITILYKTNGLPLLRQAAAYGLFLQAAVRLSSWNRI
ncbi:MAG: hypothetical protein LBD23_18435 [Oscillospiraceae bacterium]|nr:hypothetical protein [Oscillospiraceae bacterium]